MRSCVTNEYNIPLMFKFVGIFSHCNLWYFSEIKLFHYTGECELFLNARGILYWIDYIMISNEQAGAELCQAQIIISINYFFKFQFIWSRNSWAVMKFNPSYLINPIKLDLTDKINSKTNIKKFYFPKISRLNIP